MAQAPPGPSVRRPFARRFLSGTAAAGLSSFGTIALTVLLLPIQLTGLGAEAFGAWALIQTLSAFRGWGAMLDLGVGPAAVRLVAERSSVNDGRGAASAAMGAVAISAVGGSVGAVGIMLLAALDPGRIFGLDASLSAAFATSLVYYGMALPFELVTRSAQMSLEGLQCISLSRALELARRALVLVTTSLVALWTGDLVATAICFAIVAPLVAVATLLVLHRRLDRSALQRQSLRTLLAYGRPLLALRPLGITHRMMDRLLVGALLGPTAVAVVEIVTVVQNGAQAVPSASAHAVMPSAAWLEARSDRRTQRTLILKGTLGSLFATVPVVVIPALLADSLLRVWLGDDVPFVAVTVLPFAVAYSAIVATAHVSSEFLAGSGRAGIVVRSSFIAVIVNLILTVVLVRQIGVLGAFISTLVTTPIASAPIVINALRVVGASRRQFLREVIMPVVLPSAALVAVVLGARALLEPRDLLLLILGSVAGGAAYVGVANWTVPWRPILADFKAQSPSEMTD